MTDTAPPPIASLKPHRLLLIRNAADVTYEEVGSVTGIAGALGLTTTIVDRAHGQSIAETASGCYDTVYLAGHGRLAQGVPVPTTGIPNASIGAPDLNGPQCHAGPLANRLTLRGGCGLSSASGGRHR